MWRSVGFSCGSSGASSGSTLPLAMITWSAAWLMMNASCEPGSRRLSVCSTAPMDGTAR